jgi:hypothetical protein
MEETYRVYIKTNENNCITDVNSSAFLDSTDGWTEIDNGTGDKYHHAQGNYFDKPLTDKNGLYNYKLVDGKIIERTKEDKAPDLALANASREIAELKVKLAQTDYIAAKIAEGSATVEEYSEEIRKRREWRARINELENNQ